MLPSFGSAFVQLFVAWLCLVQFWFSFVQLFVAWFSLVELWFILLWPNFIWSSFGSTLTQLCVAWFVLVQLWFSFGSAFCGLILYGSALVQLWFSFGSACCGLIYLSIYLSIYLFVYLAFGLICSPTPNLFIWRSACSARQHRIDILSTYLFICLFCVRLALLANTE